MKNINKETLTAYALGELSEKERAEIKELIQSNPELQREVDEIQSFGSFLSKELKQESMPKMEETKREELVNSMKEKTSWFDFFKGYKFPIGVISSAMVAMLIMIAFVPTFQSFQEKVESENQMGLETSLALKDEANKAQLIPPPPAPREDDDGIADAVPSAPGTVADLEEVDSEPRDFHRMNVADKGSAATKKKKPVTSVKQGGASKVLAKRERKMKKSGLFSAFGSGQHAEMELAQSGDAASVGMMLKENRQVFIPPGRGRFGESYESVAENPFKAVSSAPLSTFSIDVDTASYTNIRRYITQYQSMPPAEAVRIEEMINYFDYKDPEATGDDPFSVNMEVADSPWSEGHKLVRIGIKGKKVAAKDRKSNLVFFVDVSGSMGSPDKLQGTLVAIAKDVKIQVEFNPNNVAEYRLIGYENRQLAAKDFNDDKKDAGEIGSGHTVVALYEVKPKGFEQQGVDSLKYQTREKKEEVAKGAFGDELLTVKLRYKDPKGSTSKLLTFPVKSTSRAFEKASTDLRWTASVAGFGMMLKGSTHKGDLNYDKLIKMADEARWSGKGYDTDRSELVEMIKSAKKMTATR